MSEGESLDKKSSHPDDRLLLTIPEVAYRLGLGRSFVYELVMKGEIKSVKIGRARRVPVSAVEEFVRAKVLQADNR